MENVVTKTYTSLEAWRKDKGFNQKQAADFLGIARSHYRAIATGYTSPRASLAKTIIEKTGVSLDALVGAA